MATTQYIGARYVPLFADPLDWSIESTYEALTIVYDSGNSYTSRQAVPKGIDITNTKYWALTGNYNAQIEAYRKEVAAYDGRITENASAIAKEVSRAIAEETSIKALITAAQTAADNALSLAQTNEKDIATLDSEMAGTADSGLKTLIANNADAISANTNAISAAQEAPIYFSTYQLSDYQTVLITKIVKADVEMELKQCNNTDETNTSNVISWLQDASDEYIYAVNCDRWSTDNKQSYNNIINGVIHTDSGISTSETNANYFAFNDINSIAFYKRSDVTVQNIKTAGYNNAFVMGYTLLQNGTDVTSTIPADYMNGHEPITAIGWNDVYMYIFNASGRSVYQKGITPAQVVTLAKKYNCTNCALLDGGGSVQSALKLNGSMVKCTPSPNVPRKIPLALAFKVKDSSRKYLDTASLASIQSFANAYHLNTQSVYRKRVNASLNTSLAARTSGFYSETDALGGAEEAIDVQANINDMQLPIKIEDNKGIIWSTSGVGTSVNLYTKQTVTFQFTAATAGSFTGRIVKHTLVNGSDSTVTIDYVKLNYNDNSNNYVTGIGGGTIPLLPKDTRDTWFSVELRSSTDILLKELCVTEVYTLGSM